MQLNNLGQAIIEAIYEATKYMDYEEYHHIWFIIGQGFADEIGVPFRA